MSDEQARFLNYENSMSIYRSKTAMILGTLYFSKGYQSTPVLGFQFAECNDPNADQKTFNWDAEEKSWYFPTYDKCYELFCKLSKWKRILMALKESRNTNNDEISSKYKDFAEKQKISNPIKKKSIYISVRYYNGYFLTFTLVGPAKVSVSLTEDEFDMILQFIGDFIRNYHNLALMHRHIMIARGLSKDSGGNSSGNTSGSRSDSGSGKNNYSGNRLGGGKKSSAPPDDDFGGEPAQTNKHSGGNKSSGDSVDELLHGSSLDDIMSGVSTDDIPF